jgi:hypothetical protein
MLEEAKLVHIHSTSFAVLVATMYSTSVLESATMGCSLLDHPIAPLSMTVT